MTIRWPARRKPLYNKDMLKEQGPQGPWVAIARTVRSLGKNSTCGHPTEMAR
jgi:hypothetical protein